jgi:hypothetical protein
MADVVEIVVLAASANDFLAGSRSVVRPTFTPEKDFLELIHPALTNSSVGSSAGIRDELLTTLWP